MLSDGTLEIKLRKSIEVAGVHEPVESLIFHECSEGYDSYYMKLRKFVLSGQLKTPELMEKFKGIAKEDDNSLPAGDEVEPLHLTDEQKHMDESKGFSEVLKMTLGSCDELEELVKVFGHMVGYSGGNSICTVNGQRVKEGAWSRLHIEDKIDCAVLYCSFFGIGLDLALNKDTESVQESLTVVKQL